MTLVVVALVAGMAGAGAARANSDCGGNGLFLVAGNEFAKVDSERTRAMTAIGAVMERSMLCSDAAQSSYVFGLQAEATYAFGKFRQPSFSSKAAGVGPEFCYRSKTGYGVCGTILGQLEVFKNGATFIDFIPKYEAAGLVQMSANVAFRLSVAYAAYPLKFTPVRQVKDLSVLAGIGLTAAGPRG